MELIAFSVAAIAALLMALDLITDREEDEEEGFTWRIGEKDES
jgi:hypothetical protein